MTTGEDEFGIGPRHPSGTQRFSVAGSATPRALLASLREASDSCQSGGHARASRDAPATSFDPSGIENRTHAPDQNIASDLRVISRPQPEPQPLPFAPMREAGRTQLRK